MLRDPNLIPLSHQHHNALALCVTIDRTLSQNSTPTEVEVLAHKVGERYDIELANHFEIEEQILFPAFPGPMTDELIAEHRKLEALVARVREEPSAAALTEFTALLRAHVRREENELFEAMQREVPADTLKRMGAEIERRAVRVCL